LSSPRRAARLLRWLLAGGLLVAGGAGCGGGEEELWRVEKGAFLHQVRAEGVLRAAVTHKLNAPRAEQTLRVAWLAEDGKRVEAGEVVARFDRQPVDQQMLTGRRDLEKAELDGLRLERQDRAQRGDLATTQETAELERNFAQQFRKQDETVFSRQQIAESTIDQELAATRSESAAAALGSQERLARAEAELVSIAKRKAMLQIDLASKGYEALEVRTPQAGIFLRTRGGPRGERLEPGGELWPGMPIGEVPLAGDLQAEVYVLEADAGGLAAGQEAEVRIDAQPEKLYRARITRLDAAARPRFRGSPVQTFAVTLAFEKPAEITGKLGQQVTARLIVARRDEALVVPRQAIAQRDGKNFALVRRGGRTESVEVALGPAAAGRVVVESGLEEGDLLLLPRAAAEADSGAATPAGGGAAGGPGR
jgi:HlyD family secretion protein